MLKRFATELREKERQRAEEKSREEEARRMRRGGGGPRRTRSRRSCVSDGRGPRKSLGSPKEDRGPKPRHSNSGRERTPRGRSSNTSGRAGTTRRGDRAVCNAGGAYGGAWRNGVAPPNPPHHLGIGAGTEGAGGSGRSAGVGGDAPTEQWPRPKGAIGGSAASSGTGSGERGGRVGGGSGHGSGASRERGGRVGGGSGTSSGTSNAGCGGRVGGSGDSNGERGGRVGGGSGASNGERGGRVGGGRGASNGERGGRVGGGSGASDGKRGGRVGGGSGHGSGTSNSELWRREPERQLSCPEERERPRAPMQRQASWPQAQLGAEGPRWRPVRREEWPGAVERVLARTRFTSRRIKRLVNDGGVRYRVTVSRDHQEVFREAGAQ
ncbi:glycine-rich cell wall structural protein 1-like [Drosophila obscura]|uniref:glycine-rich cell wall structural protein 1-like n=1 Tax=Drosophila obscura TaxID=7282 RepID=UPI001BB0E757|nr:glycine-rich cell wall structural protein 1-like [Drosophila obscura]